MYVLFAVSKDWRLHRGWMDMDTGALVQDSKIHTVVSWWSLSPFRCIVGSRVCPVPPVEIFGIVFLCGHSLRKTPGRKLHSFEQFGLVRLAVLAHDVEQSDVLTLGISSARPTLPSVTRVSVSVKGTARAPAACHAS